jgi:hypothetical protein
MKACNRLVRYWPDCWHRLDEQRRQERLARWERVKAIERVLASVGIEAHADGYEWLPPELRYRPEPGGTP